jgi:hypothetical protein
MRLLPLPQQVGVVEGLAVVVREIPQVLSLKDQHMLAFLSELLKMASVADGDMTDSTMNDYVVDKNGFAGCAADHKSHNLEHASALFHRRDCVVMINGVYFIVPGELPAGVQLRMSLITLLHAVIRSYSDQFFDAESSTPVGTYINISNISFYLILSHIVFPLRQHSPTRRKFAIPVACIKSTKGRHGRT